MHRADQIKHILKKILSDLKIKNSFMWTSSVLSDIFISSHWSFYMLKDDMRYHSSKMRKNRRKGKKIKIGEKWAKSFAWKLENEPKSQSMWIPSSYREQFAISFLDLFYMLRWEKKISFEFLPGKSFSCIYLLIIAKVVSCLLETVKNLLMGFLGAK